MIQVFDNFLDKELFDDLKAQIFHNQFPWYFSGVVASKNDDENFYFVHWFYNIGDGKLSDRIDDLLLPVLSKLDCKRLIRAKLNLFTRQPENVYHGKHIDLIDKLDSTTATLYMNTNNGGTWTADKVIDSVENRLLIMSGDVEHSSISQTDEKLRILYNINYDETTSN